MGSLFSFLAFTAKNDPDKPVPMASLVGETIFAVIVLMIIGALWFMEI